MNKSTRTNKSLPLRSRLLRKLDKTQQKHSYLAFPYAVIKKYSEDEAGSHAALVTYYGFLSLFPLLIVALSITQLSVLHNAHLKAKVIDSLNNNFPIVGEQLGNSAHPTKKAGFALFISLLIALYGTRGVASALQRAVNHIWQIPKYMRGGFKSKLESFAIIFLIGIGFIFSGFLSSYAVSSSGNVALKILAISLSLVLTFVVLLNVYKICLSENRRLKDFAIGSVASAVGLQIIQLLGGYIITHELRHFSELYGVFAATLTIMFWIYLQTRIFLYAAEVDSVRVYGLWPRSLNEKPLNKEDEKAYSMYAGREHYKKPPKEEISVKFKKSPD